jgi:hypothetical protein
MRNYKGRLEKYELAEIYRIIEKHYNRNCCWGDEEFYELREMVGVATGFLLPKPTTYRCRKQLVDED